MDGIAHDLEGKARVLRVNVMEDVGSEAAHRYGVRGLPTTLVFDGQGSVVYTQAGLPDRKRVMEQVELALGNQ